MTDVPFHLYEYCRRCRVHHAPNVHVKVVGVNSYTDPNGYRRERSHTDQAKTYRKERDRTPQARAYRNAYQSTPEVRERYAAHKRIASAKFYAISREYQIVEPVDPLVVLQRDEWICHICLHPIDQSAQPHAPLSGCIDHITPVHSYDTVRAAHLGCNSSVQWQRRSRG